MPKGNDLQILIYSEDGSIEGYSATLHARSKSGADGSHTSRIATARCKTSNLDVGDNELQGSLLAGKMAEQSLEGLSNLPDDLVIAFLGDSQCTAHTLNPTHVQQDRRRHNLVVKVHRVMRRIHMRYPARKMLFVWGPSELNPADLNSKSHPNLLEVVNGTMWREGPKAFTAGIFPSEEMIVYAYYQNGCFEFRGLKETDAHLTTCDTCQVESGLLVADKLVYHTVALAGQMTASRQSDANGGSQLASLTQSGSGSELESQHAVDSCTSGQAGPNTAVVS